MRSFAKREEKDKKKIKFPRKFLDIIIALLFISVLIYIIVSNINKNK